MLDITMIRILCCLLMRRNRNISNIVWLSGSMNDMHFACLDWLLRTAFTLNVARRVTISNIILVLKEFEKILRRQTVFSQALSELFTYVDILYIISICQVPGLYVCLYFSSFSAVYISVICYLANPTSNYLYNHASSMIMYGANRFDCNYLMCTVPT